MSFSVRRPFASVSSALLLVAALAGDAALARAEERKASAGLSGTYAIEGTFANGNAYTGTVTLDKWKTVQLRGKESFKGAPSFTTYKLKFQYSTDWAGVGVGVLLGNRFYFAMAHDGETYCVAVFRPKTDLGSEVLALREAYVAKNREREAEWARGKSKDKSFFEVKGDPWFTDIWESRFFALFFQGDGDWGTEGIASEGLPNQTQTLGAGHWSWQCHWYDEKGKDTSALLGNSGDYESEALENGALKLTKRIWRTKKKGEDVYSEPEACAGLLPDPETMVVSFWGDGSEGVGYYDVVGHSFEGKIADAEDPGSAYVQKLTVPDGVVARNPDLFK